MTKEGENISYMCSKMELGVQDELLYRALTEQDFKIEEDKMLSITMAFLVGIAFGFGSKYNEKDKILKTIREMIDRNEKESEE